MDLHEAVVSAWPNRQYAQEQADALAVLITVGPPLPKRTPTRAWGRPAAALAVLATSDGGPLAR